MSTYLDSKTCKDCGETRDVSDFYKYRKNGMARRSVCRDCTTLQRKKWGAKNKDKVKQYNLYQFYGISSDDYTALLDRQQGKCAICKNGSNGNERFVLCVDHCHTSGKVRSLLCSSCNTGLGYFQENTDYLQSAIQYLMEHN